VRRLVPVGRPEGVEVDEIGRLRSLAPAKDDADHKGGGDDGREQRRRVCLDLGLSQLDCQFRQGAVLLGLLEARGGECQGRDSHERDEVVDDGGETSFGDLEAQRGGDVFSVFLKVFCCCCCWVFIGERKRVGM